MKLLIRSRPTPLFTFLLCSLLVFSSTIVHAQYSAARVWNEILLESIRNDFARPTVHARNLFHISAAMYDGWSAYDSTAGPYYLGRTRAKQSCKLKDPIPLPSNVKSAQEEALSYAAYRLLKHRFQNAPGDSLIHFLLDSAFIALGYDSTDTSTNYVSDSASALGNYIASCYIRLGLKDSANEQLDYSNTYYQAGNPALLPKLKGNPNMVDPNRWQPIQFDVFVDQSGNVINNHAPAFVSAEWGEVYPFALNDTDLTTKKRKGFEYQIWSDPGGPPLLDTINGGALSEEYKWNFALVSIWSSHLDAADTNRWDISPGKMGNHSVSTYPTSMTDLRNFYDLYDGGDNGIGHSSNPYTAQAYAPNEVKRGDFTRVLAEFWADGPDSETPPGHWFVLLNYVNDQALLVKKWNGKGDLLSDLEWDVKSYFTLGGAMHDAAITAWSLKGWYDYVRPISAIRYMADKGQSTDTSLSNYHIAGVPLHLGYIEVVDSGDTLAQLDSNNIGKIKLYAWRGPEHILNPDSDVAGVGWILAEDWWPYQRPTFITPPFAGYVSGHSTYSRTAAEVLTLITGDRYFPGGIGEFLAKKNEFLVFEDGPSEDVTLQWATYQDASDQCSFSRIWGGIHPPADDMPGRLIGLKLGPQAYEHAITYFDKRKPKLSSLVAIPGLLDRSIVGNSTFTLWMEFDENMDTTIQPYISFPVENPDSMLFFNTKTSFWSDSTVFTAYFNVNEPLGQMWDIDVAVQQAADRNGNKMDSVVWADVFSIDGLNGIKTTPVQVQFKVFPNPSQDKATIDLGKEYLNPEFVILNAQGKIVKNLVAPKKRFVNIDLQELAVGNYIILINTKEGLTQLKLSIEK